MSKPFQLSARVRSFRYAFSGFASMLRSQHNAWIHGMATVLVVVAGWVWQVSTMDWCLLVIAMVGVWTAEALNTALEFLADVASPDFHPLVEKAKDVAAAGVLVAATGAAIVGVLIFVPRWS